MRLLGVDSTEPLYIGASRRLPGRMADLKKSVYAAYQAGKYKTVWPHMVGRKISSSFRAAFPLESMRVLIQGCKLEHAANEDQHFHDEAAELRAYQARYGETPPLNG